MPPPAPKPAPINLYDSVVHVITPPSIQGNKEVYSLGSGFPVATESVNGALVTDLVTNHHVVGNNRNVTIQVNGERCSAKVAKIDYKNDLALLQVRADTCGAPLPLLQLAAPDSVDNGNRIISAGFAGNSTQLRLNWGPVINQNDSIIKAYTELKEGQSGGPTFDRSGRVVGVNDFVYGEGHNHVITRVDGSGYIPIAKVYDLLGYRG